jgi:mRNA-degrading endonuclease RelE of RelBE toxin-antitoxin system
MTTPKNAGFKIFLLPPVLSAIDGTAPDIQRRLLAALGALTFDAQPIGSVKLTPDEGHSLGAGEFRVLYRIDEKTRRVFIYKVQGPAAPHS